MTRDNSPGAPPPARLGSWLLIAATALGLADAIYNYFMPGDGINGSEGALLVIISTLLQLIAAALIAGGLLRGWVGGLFEFLIFLDLVGTAAAAYLLNAWILLALTVIAFVGFVIHLAQQRRVVAVREVTP